MLIGLNLIEAYHFQFAICQVLAGLRKALPQLGRSKTSLLANVVQENLVVRIHQNRPVRTTTNLQR